MNFGYMAGAYGIFWSTLNSSIYVIQVTFINARQGLERQTV